jgi:hypothetical protein
MKIAKTILTICLVLLSLVSCVQEEHLKTVTFKVDMTAVTSVYQVGIKGEFTSPPWKVIVPLTDADHDGVYETTLSQATAASAAEFKFVHNEVYELKGQKNRVLRFEYKPETLTYTAVWDISKEKIKTTN